MTKKTLNIILNVIPVIVMIWLITIFYTSRTNN